MTFDDAAAFVQMGSSQPSEATQHPLCRTVAPPKARTGQNRHSRLGLLKRRIPALFIQPTNNKAEQSALVHPLCSMQNTIHALIKKRGEIAGQHRVAHKAADALKADLYAIDRALALCSYQDDPKAIPARGKCKPLFGCNELKLTTINVLRDAPADDRTIAARITDAPDWGEDIYHDAPKRVRRALRGQQK